MDFDFFIVVNWYSKTIHLKIMWGIITQLAAKIVI